MSDDLKDAPSQWVGESIAPLTHSEVRACNLAMLAAAAATKPVVDHLRSARDDGTFLSSLNQNDGRWRLQFADYIAAVAPRRGLIAFVVATGNPFLTGEEFASGRAESRRNGILDLLEADFSALECLAAIEDVTTDLREARKSTGARLAQSAGKAAVKTILTAHGVPFAHSLVERGEQALRDLGESGDELLVRKAQLVVASSVTAQLGDLSIAGAFRAEIERELATEDSRAAQLASASAAAHAGTARTGLFGTEQPTAAVRAIQARIRVLHTVLDLVPDASVPAQRHAPGTTVLHA